MGRMRSFADRLNALSESWKPGGKTDRGKKDGLPDVDYWRTVQGQRIGFVGSPGKGLPITGSRGARDALLGGGGANLKDNGFRPGGTKLKDSGFRPGGTRKMKDNEFRRRIMDLDKKEGALTAEQYKSAMDSAASKAEDEISRILSEFGLGRDDFESSLSKPSGSDLAAPTVMERLAESLASANKEKYGEPTKSGEAYGFPISYKNMSDDFRDGGLGSAVNDWQAFCAPSIADPDVPPDRRDEMSEGCEIKYRFAMGRAHAVTSQKYTSVNLYYKQDAMGSFGDGAPMTGSGKHRRLLFHELSHALESRDPGLKDASIRFLESRVGRERPKRLRSLTGSKSYGADEWAFSDKFATPYVGKVYPNDSEVTSMAMQAFSSPYEMAALYRDDRNLFHYAVAVATGAFKEAKKNG